MLVNTTTGSVKLTKTEHKRLEAVLPLLVNLEKHGDGELCTLAEEAADAVGRVLEQLRDPAEAVVSE
jgi:hypothetical protein